MTLHVANTRPWWVHRTSTVIICGGGASGGGGSGDISSGDIGSGDIGGISLLMGIMV